MSQNKHCKIDSYIAPLTKNWSQTFLLAVPHINLLALPHFHNHGARRKQFESGAGAKRQPKIFWCVAPVFRGASPFERALQK